jgi:hypothetical protein
MEDGRPKTEDGSQKKVKRWKMEDRRPKTDELP